MAVEMTNHDLTDDLRFCADMLANDRRVAWSGKEPDGSNSNAGEVSQMQHDLPWAEAAVKRILTEYDRRDLPMTAFSNLQRHHLDLCRRVS